MKNFVMAAAFILVLSPLSVSALSYVPYQPQAVAMPPATYSYPQYVDYSYTTYTYPQYTSYGYPSYTYPQNYGYGYGNYGATNYGGYAPNYNYGNTGYTNYGTGYGNYGYGNTSYAPTTSVYPLGVSQGWGYPGYSTNSVFPNAVTVNTFPQTSNSRQRIYGYQTGDSTLFYPTCYQPAYGDYASCYFDATQPVRDPYTGRVY